jgi:hypothetical protein
MSLTCLVRRAYRPSALLAEAPPQLRSPHKRLAFDLLCPPGAEHGGVIELTRWAALALPAHVEPFPTAIDAVFGVYDYAGPTDGVWHVNFADPQLFVAYGSSLLAQDELQALEHPLLGSLREVLLAEGQPALTEEDGAPTPVLVADVERRGALDTAGLYGNRFAAASAERVQAALTPLVPAPRSHLVCIAAPAGGRGPYFRRQIDQIVRTAFTGFAAAAAESRRRWPGVPVELRTGFWGCGAFGGNRQLMALCQVLAARLAGADRLRFYTFDTAGMADFAAASAALDGALAAGRPGEPLDALLERIADLDYVWGTSDGT